MPAWLLRFLSPLINMLLSFGLDKILGLVKDYFAERNAKKVVKEEQAKASEKLKEDLGKAGLDEEAQKAALDKFFSRPR